MRRLFVLLVLPLFIVRLPATDMPAYLRTALARFSPDVPPGWAYTITTARDSEQAVERFDPSAPVGRQWTLLQRNRRAPTSDEINSYQSYKITTAQSARPTFQRGDLDLGTVKLESEDARYATFSCRFRDDVNDQLLGHLSATFHVDKQSALVESFELELIEAYSPVLTMKTLELKLQTTFSPPQPDRPSLPAHSHSHFRGRVLIVKSIAEDVVSDYSDFARVKANPTRAEPSGE